MSDGDLTMRDYFAAKAMLGIFSTLPENEEDKSCWTFWDTSNGIGWNSANIPERVAKMSYDMADAMIARRAAK